ncbi:MAG: alpha/beta hydrolase [Micromonosporaceae bacterium]|jgi:pimeloyl-ACP methyl ester carboxylesterase|nr:alpha/beta hydrolase [Micromonosporaceae bacterium]
MHEPTEHTVLAAGFRTHYWEAGPPEPAEATVVLVHEGAVGADAATTWGALIPLLARRYRVLAPDLLGYGDTDKVVYLDRPPHQFRAAHLAAFCEQVGVAAAGAHFVGHSLGGSLVLRALARATPVLPARSGVSISGTGGPWRSAAGVAELGRFDGTEQDVWRLVRLMVDDYPGLADVVRARYANTRKPGHVEACLAARLSHPTMPRPAGDDGWPAALRDCPVPILVIGGERDPLLEPGWTKHFAQVSPLVSVQTLDSRHAPNMDQPETVARLLFDFFDRSASADRPHGGAG